MPQAGTAHCTSYDFFSQHTESAHTVIWALSGRGLVKVLDKWKGLVFTRKFILFKISRLLVFNFKFRFITEDEKVVFVKFIWKPLQRLSNLLWAIYIQY